MNRYLETLQELHSIKVVNIGEEELLKVRDSRIQKLNEELAQLRGKL